jgi:hypothetical protein
MPKPPKAIVDLGEDAVDMFMGLVQRHDVNPKLAAKIVQGKTSQLGTEFAKGSYEPTNAVKAYKLFREKKGDLYPLYIRANEAVPTGEWIGARSGELLPSGKVKGTGGGGSFARREGWHAGDTPSSQHIGGTLPAVTGNRNPVYRFKDQKWAEVEMPNDFDWQSVANQRGINPQGEQIAKESHITDQIPYGGNYRYKTNPNMEGEWMIGGNMKVGKMLTDAEVRKINKAAGVKDLPYLDEVIKKLKVKKKDLTKVALDELKKHYPDLLKTLGIASVATVGSSLLPDGQAMAAPRPSPEFFRWAVSHGFNLDDLDPRIMKTAGGGNPRAGDLATISGLDREIIRPQGSFDIPTFSLTDLEGKTFITGMADATDAGGVITSINGVKLKRPVDLMGGQKFMYDSPHLWASAEGALAGKPNAMLNVNKQLKKFYTTKEDAILLPWKMAPTGSDFAHMTGEVMLSYLESVLTKGDKRALNQAMKELVPDWKGIDSPDALNMFRNLPAGRRKAVQKMLDMNFRDQGLSVGQARMAIMDEAQIPRDQGMLHLGGQIDSSRGVSKPSGHPSYPAAVEKQGEPLGMLEENVYGSDLLPEVVGSESKYGTMVGERPSNDARRFMEMSFLGGRIDDKLLKKLDQAGVLAKKYAAPTIAATTAGAANADQTPIDYEDLLQRSMHDFMAAKREKQMLPERQAISDFLKQDDFNRKTPNSMTLQNLWDTPRPAGMYAADAAPQKDYAGKNDSMLQSGIRSAAQWIGDTLERDTKPDAGLEMLAGKPSDAANTFQNLAAGKPLGLNEYFGGYETINPLSYAVMLKESLKKRR